MPEDEYECPGCGDEFPTERGMKSHYGQKHEGSISGVVETCEGCGETFRRPADRPDIRNCSIGCRSRKTVTVACSWCGEDVEMHENRHKINDENFCGQDCYSKWQSENKVGEQSPTWKERRTHTCDWCGGEIEKRQSERSLEHDFCGLDCYGNWLTENNSGEDNPMWKGGYEPYYGSNWRKQRRRARERDNNECQACGVGEDETTLCVHHIKPFREFAAGDETDYEAANELENLVTLCRSCHKKYEGLPVVPRAK